MNPLRAAGSYCLLALLWLLHWLPLPWLRALGAGIGRLLFHLARDRRHVALTNLQLCFPQWDAQQRQALAKRHFIAFAQAFLDRCWLWWASPAILDKRIRVQGGEHLKHPGLATLLLAPHFVGLDAGGLKMTMLTPLVSVYSQQKNPIFNRVLLAGRQRFNQPLLLSRQDGMRKALKALRDGLPFYYLPDMDFGARDALFIPFFGVPAATITGVSRLTRSSGARVVPCLTRLVADGYEVQLLPAWPNYPGNDVAEDTMYMNQFIEDQIRQMPEQYFWVHKRFKTRPPGTPRMY